MAQSQTNKPRKSEGGLRDKRKVQNREEIMDAARRVFFEIGYNDTTVRDIVRETNLAPGTFYNYFDDKEAVFRALFAESAARLRGELNEARAPTGDVMQFVRDGVRPPLEAAFNDITIAGVLRRSRTDVYAMVELPEMIDLVDDLARDIEERIAGNEFPKLDVEMFVYSMRAVLVEVAYMVFNREPQDVEAGVDFMADLFVGGLMQIAQRDSG